MAISSVAKGSFGNAAKKLLVRRFLLFFAPATSLSRNKEGKIRMRTVGKRKKNIGHLSKGMVLD